MNKTQEELLKKVFANLFGEEEQAEDEDELTPRQEQIVEVVKNAQTFNIMDAIQLKTMLDLLFANAGIDIGFTHMEIEKCGCGEHKRIEAHTKQKEIIFINLELTDNVKEGFRQVWNAELVGYGLAKKDVVVF